MPDSVKTLKPGAVTLILYVPGGSDGIRYVPVSFVTALRARPVPRFCASTAAFTTAAPLGSETSPSIVPVVCASAPKEPNKPHAVAVTKLQIRIMVTSSLSGDDSITEENRRQSPLHPPPSLMTCIVGARVLCLLGAVPEEYHRPC